MCLPKTSPGNDFMFVLRDRWLAFVLILLLAFGSSNANAQNYENALAGFTAESFNDTDAAISSIVASGNPLAEKVIVALQEGRLLFSAELKKVYIRETSGALLDA